MPAGHRGYQRVPQTTQYYRCQELVRIDQPGCIRICISRQNETLPQPPEAELSVQMDNLDTLFEETKVIIVQEIQKGLGYSIREDQHVWQLTSARKASAFGSCKNIATVHQQNRSVAIPAGKSLW